MRRFRANPHYAKGVPREGGGMVPQYSPTAMLPARNASGTSRVKTNSEQSSVERLVTIKDLPIMQNVHFEIRGSPEWDLIHSILYLMTQKYREMNNDGKNDTANKTRLFICNQLTYEEFNKLDNGKVSTILAQQFGVGAMNVFINVIKEAGVLTRPHIDFIAKCMKINLVILKDGQVIHGWDQFDEDRIATLIVQWYGEAHYRPVVMMKQNREIRTFSQSDPVVTHLDRIVKGSQNKNTLVQIGSLL